VTGAFCTEWICSDRTGTSLLIRYLAVNSVLNGVNLLRDRTETSPSTRYLAGETQCGACGTILEDRRPAECLLSSEAEEGAGLLGFQTATVDWRGLFPTEAKLTVVPTVDLGSDRTQGLSSSQVEAMIMNWAILTGTSGEVSSWSRTLQPQADRMGLSQACS
jgi:hypothetical protein